MGRPQAPAKRVVLGNAAEEKIAVQLISQPAPPDFYLKDFFRIAVAKKIRNQIRGDAVFGGQAEIFPAAGETAVFLNAGRVHIKSIKRLLIVEGIEIDTNPVIGSDVVAAGDRAFDFIRLAVEAAKGEKFG